MKSELLERCRALEEELERSDTLAAESFRDAEVEVHSILNHLDLMEFPGGIPSGYRETLEKLDQAIHTLTLRGRVMRARYEALKDHVGELDEEMSAGAELKRQVANLREEVEGVTDYDRAAIAVSREMHESKGGIKEIFKALLMWRDAPEERLKKDKVA